VAGKVTKEGLDSGLAAERAMLAARLRARGQPEAEVARRVRALTLVHAAEVTLYGFPGLAQELRSLADGAEPDELHQAETDGRNAARSVA